MDEQTARALLGVSPTADVSAARTAFKRRAKLLHPDRADEGTRDEAQRAMAQLTEAWDTVRRSSSATGPATPPPQPASRARPPAADECQFCGAAPAADVTFRQTIGMILVWRNRYFYGTTCRACGRAMYAEAQALTLRTGWWGPISAVVSFYQLGRNRVELARLGRRTPGTRRRAPDVAAPLQALHYRNPWIRTSSIGCTILAAVVFTLAGTLWLRHNATPIPTAPSLTKNQVARLSAHSRGPVGSCLSDKLVIVACGDTTATWRIAEDALTANDCSQDHHPEALRQKSSGMVYCADPVRP